MKFILTLCLTLPLCSLASQRCLAQVLFRDDFETAVSDQWIIAEFNNSFMAEVIDGALVWTPNSTSTNNAFIDGLPNDISIRTRFQLLEEPSGEVLISVGGRDVINFPEPDTGNYYGGVTNTNRAGIGISGGSILRETSTTLNPVEQLIDLRFDIVGNQQKLWVWEAGTDMPSEPTVATENGSIDEGDHLFLSYFPLNGGAPPQVAWEFVEVRAIPEPSTAVSSLLGLIAVGFLRRRRHPTT